MTLQGMVNSARNGDGIYVPENDAFEPHVTTPDFKDLRIYGQDSPWYGFSRVESIEVLQARVILERLWLRGLWWRRGYLGAMRDLLIEDGGLRIGPHANDTASQWPSAVTMEGVHVKGGALDIGGVGNLVWTGGSVERTTGGMYLGQGKNQGTIMLQGVRFEHDQPTRLRIGGPDPVLLIGCHFVVTDVLFERGAHKDSALIGCSHVLCDVVDDRPRRWWPW